MKHVVIGGPGRSGKSTLANLLNKRWNYNVLRGDYLLKPLAKAHDDPNISIKPESHEQAVAQYAPLIRGILKKLERYETELHYVFESTMVAPDRIDEYIEDQELFEIIFVGYPSIDPQEKLKYIRTHSTKQCPFLTHTDAEVLDWIETFIAASRTTQKQCADFGYRFVDTSQNFQDVLNQVCEETGKPPSSS